MSGRWNRMESDWWEAIQPRVELPYNQECAYYDLRHLSDTRDGIPSRRVLAKRWGWSDGQVRTLLRNVDAWWDSHRGEAPRYAAPRPAGTQTYPTGPGEHQAGPNGTQRDPRETEQPAQFGTRDPSGPGEHQAGPTEHQAGPETHHTRGDPPTDVHLTSTDRNNAAPSGGEVSPQDHHPLSPMLVTQPGVERSPFYEPPAPVVVAAPVAAEVPVAPTPAPSPAAPSLFAAPALAAPEATKDDAFARCARFWGTEVHKALQRRESAGPGRESGMGKKLAAKIRAEGEDAVLDAMRYIAHSTDSKAKFLRGETTDRDGKRFVVTIETLLAHVGGYAEAWQAEQGRASSPEAAAAAGVVPPELSSKGVEQVLEVERGYYEAEHGAWPVGSPRDLDARRAIARCLAGGAYVAQLRRVFLQAQVDPFWSEHIGRLTFAKLLTWKNADERLHNALVYEERMAVQYATSGPEADAARKARRAEQEARDALRRKLYMEHHRATNTVPPVSNPSPKTFGA